MAILATFHCACANSVIVPVGNMTPDSYLAHRISYKWGNCGDRNIDEAVFAILYLPRMHKIRYISTSCRKSNARFEFSASGFLFKA